VSPIKLFPSIYTWSTHLSNNLASQNVLVLAGAVDQNY